MSLLSYSIRRKLDIIIFYLKIYILVYTLRICNTFQLHSYQEEQKQTNKTPDRILENSPSLGYLLFLTGCKTLCPGFPNLDMLPKFGICHLGMAFYPGKLL